MPDIFWVLITLIFVTVLSTQYKIPLLAIPLNTIMRVSFSSLLNFSLNFEVISPWFFFRMAKNACITSVFVTSRKKKKREKTLIEKEVRTCIKVKDIWLGQLQSVGEDRVTGEAGGPTGNQSPVGMDDLIAASAAVVSEGSSASFGNARSGQKLNSILLSIHNQESM